MSGLDQAFFWLLRLIEAALRGQLLEAFAEMAQEVLWEPMVWWYGPEWALTRLETLG